MCSICCKKLTLSENLYSTDCGHIFHLHCMQEWNKRSTCCPRCRKQSPLTHRIYLESNDIDKIEELRNPTILENKLQKGYAEIVQLKKDLNDFDTKNDDIEGTLKKSLAYNGRLERKIETCHLNMLKWKEDLCKCNEEKDDLEEMIRTTLTTNTELQSQLRILEVKLNVHNSNNESNANIIEQGEEQQNLQKNESDNAINHDQQQQTLTKLTKTPTKVELFNNEKSMWFIRQTSQGDYQVNGPFHTISDGIIAAQKETLQETSLIIRGVKNIYQGESWLSYIENLAKNVSNHTLANGDVVKATHNYNKKELFVQFRTADWRNNFINYYNDNPGECGEGFSTRIPFQLSTYDTFFEYVKTLKVLGYKNFYRHNDSTVLVMHDKSTSFVIKDKKEVDDLINTNLKIS